MSLPSRALLLSLLAHGTALAGETETEFDVGSSLVAYDNLDFRPLDESSDQAILDSDDRSAFGYLWVGAELRHEVSDDLAVTFDLSNRSQWGGDQVGSVNAYGGIVYVRALSMDYTPAVGLGDDENPFLLRVGRQVMEIGGLPDGANDYVLDEITDGVRVDLPLGTAGHLTLLPLSIVSPGGDVANSNIADLAVREDNAYNFNGATLTTRYGGVLVMDGVSDAFEARGHFFYTDIGASGTGMDISYDGMLGNFIDRDYTFNYGLRGLVHAGNLDLAAEFAGSGGVDRKELVAPDVNTTGFAGGLAVVLDTSDIDNEQGGVAVMVDGWYAQGAGYTSDGMRWTHGYVSLKGDQMGGYVADNLMGWHPSAYTDDAGVLDTEHDRARKAGSLVAHLGGAYKLGNGAEAGVDAWYMADTGVTAITNFDDVDLITPPYGYAREEFAAEERLGKSLGTEFDGHVDVPANENLSFSAVGGVLLPGAFYAIPVARVAGDGDNTMLGGQEAAWALGVSTRLVW